jgi:3-polyprenyl-4-hydroxybenzoate decarboxylase
MTRDAHPFCPGCLVVEGASFEQARELPEALAISPGVGEWPLIILVDDLKSAVANPSAFLWTTFTRFDPASDTYAAGSALTRNHVSYAPPIVIDARMKPWYPPEVESDPDTERLVARRWNEYFPRS